MNWSRGFTLVELMVSISIVTVMMAVGLPAFQNYGRKAELNQAATDIQTAILQAHNLALAPESDKPSSEKYYGVKFDVIKNSFDVVRGNWEASSSGCPVLPDPITLVEHHSLPAGISMKSPTATPQESDCVGYLVGTGATPANGNRTSITLKSSKIPEGNNKNIQQVKINSVTGQVSIQQTIVP